MRRRRLLLASLLPVVLLIALVGIVLATVNTDTTITIATGVPGSASYDTAEKMRVGLEKGGFNVEIVSTSQTLDLVNFLADPENPVDVTFLSEGVDPDDFPRVTSLGTIGLQPLLFGAMPGSHAITSISDAKGARIDIGPPGSVRADFATQVLAEFGITESNSTFLNLPADASLADLTAAGVQVVTARWSDPRTYLREMAARNEVRVIPLPEAQALAGRVRSAEVVTLPYAAFQISPPLPNEPLPTIAQLVTVVADEEVSPGAAYTIARELTILFGAGDAISAPGEFPNFSDRQLPINQYAADFYDTGAVPWQYSHLPPLIADSFVSIIVIGTTILVLASVYSLFLPEVYSVWTGIIRPRSEERSIHDMEQALAQGRELTFRQRRRLGQILQEQDAGRVLRQRADNLRPLLSAPIDDETDNARDPVTGEVIGDQRTDGPAT